MSLCPFLACERSCCMCLLGVAGLIALGSSGCCRRAPTVACWAMLCHDVLCHEPEVLWHLTESPAATVCAALAPAFLGECELVDFLSCLLIHLELSHCYCAGGAHRQAVTGGSGLLFAVLAAPRARGRMRSSSGFEFALPRLYSKLCSSSEASLPAAFLSVIVETGSYVPLLSAVP